MGGEIMSSRCCYLLFAALGSSVPTCRGSFCLLGVCTLCVHPCVTCVDAFICVCAKQRCTLITLIKLKFPF